MFTDDTSKGISLIIDVLRLKVYAVVGHSLITVKNNTSK